MLIEEIKRSITQGDKKSKNFILNSILGFTLRLREIKRNRRNYIH